MTLLDILFGQLAPIYGQFVRRESPLGPWPELVVLTEAQRARRRAARMNQVGKPKAANRIKR